MNTRRFVSVLFGLLSFCFAAAFAATAADRRWNLLIITADDLNGDSMGWMGSKLGATPNVDSFAATCHQFRQCHVSAPICQPSRSALMTGRVPHRNGALGFNPINLDVPTMPEVMSSNGYFTAAINKTGHMMPRQKFNWDLALDGSGKDPKALREHLGQCMKAAAAAGKPFFINANSTDPHRPFAGSARAEGEEEGPRGKKASKNQAAAAPVKMFAEFEVVVPSFLENIPDVRKEVAQYFSSVRRLDQTFSELIIALKTSGHLDDTVIVFLSDHGMSMPYSKATLYRNGTSTPLLLCWPGMGQPIVDNANMVSSLDIMPTVLELLNVKRPDGLDGRSLLPLLRGERQPDRDHVFTHVNTVSSGKSFPGRCVRTTTRAYIWNAWPDGKTQYRVEAMSGLSWNAMAKAADTDPKIKGRVQHFLYRCAEEFYDEEKDPDERHNLIDDPQYQNEIGRMKKLLLAHMEQTNDSLLGQFRRTGKDSGSNRGGAKFIEPDDSTGRSVAVVVNEGMALAHTAQVFPLNRRGRVRPNSDITAQTELVLQHLDTALKSAGSDLSQIVKLNVYLMENHTASEVQAVLARKFSGEAKPAVCFVTGELPEPNARVAMDAVAIVPLTPSLSPSDGERDGVRGIASGAVLPAGSRIYVSGMADTNALPDATRKTLEKLIAAIGNLGLAKKDVVQLKAFLQPMSKVGVVREQIVRFFDGHAPPVVFVDWISPAPNPPIEIELIAAAKGDFSKEADSMSFLTPSGTSDSKVFRRVARVNHGKLIYISGLYGMKAQDAGAQVREIFGSLGGVLKTTDSDFEHLAKATYYVTDNDASNKLNDIRPEFYHPQRAPAASKAKVKGVGATSKTVTMDMIAVTK